MEEGDLGRYASSLAARPRSVGVPLATVQGSGFKVYSLRLLCSGFDQASSWTETCEAAPCLGFRGFGA